MSQGFINSQTISAANIQNDAFDYVLDTGAANAYVAILAPAVTAYTAGLRISLKIANSNTGASTLNVNSLGVKTITDTLGAAITAGYLTAGMVADLRYDGTNFQLLNPAVNSGRLLNVQVISASGNATPSSALVKKWLFFLKGGGGAGQSGTNAGTLPGQGGSEGGTLVGYVNVTYPTSYAVTIGAGGTPAAAGGGAAGGNGGNSTLTIGATTYTGGGGGGGGAVGAGYGSAGGVNSNNGTYGFAGIPAATVIANITSGSGAGGGPGGGAGTAGAGTTSLGNSGAGGSGGYGNNAGGSGGSGYLIIYEYS